MIPKAAKAAYDRERYARLGPRQVNRDLANKAAYDKARNARLKLDPRHIAMRKARDARRYVEVIKPNWVSKATGARIPVELPRTYTGHQWLDMARAVVGDKQTEFGWELYDRYNDEMGEAVLALLEGGDPKEAVKAFRKREFIPRHMTSSISEWQGDEELAWKVDRIIPQAPSAEDEAVARETVQGILRDVPIHWGHGKGLMGTSKQQAPAQRRQRAA